MGTRRQPQWLLPKKQLRTDRNELFFIDRTDLPEPNYFFIVHLLCPQCRAGTDIQKLCEYVCGRLLTLFLLVLYEAIFMKLYCIALVVAIIEFLMKTGVGFQD